MINTLENRIIFTLWTGPEIMSPHRAAALWTILKNTTCPIVLITEDTVSDWVLKDHPLHPAYKFLSSTHKADYLRCYLMHHYGGGYTDIKKTSVKWGEYFDLLNTSVDRLALGYPEIPDGIPHITGEFGDQIRAVHKELIGLCSFIFKPNTVITQNWLNSANTLLDHKYVLLEQSPGKFALDQTGIILPSGEPSTYPLRWAELLGEILHPLFYTFRKNLITAPIEPQFHSYR